MRDGIDLMLGVILCAAGCTSSSSVGVAIDSSLQADPQCASDAPPAFCSGTLVQCVANSACAALDAGTPYCFQRFCVECVSWQDCPAQSPGCTSASQSCGSCTVDSDCPPGRVCPTATLQCALPDGTVALDASRGSDSGTGHDAGGSPDSGTKRDAASDARPDRTIVDAKAPDDAHHDSGAEGGRHDAVAGG
jgi:hypothetical protein